MMNTASMIGRTLTRRVGSNSGIYTLPWLRIHKTPSAAVAAGVGASRRDISTLTKNAPVPSSNASVLTPLPLETYSNSKPTSISSSKLQSQFSSSGIPGLKNNHLMSGFSLGGYNVNARHKSTSTPLNTMILFVPQQEAWIIERMGRFNRILEPGLNILIPIIDKIKYVNSLKEIAIDIPKQSAITKDNVVLTLDGVLYLRIVDPYKASYGVEDPEFAITQLAQTTMRSELGKISLDSVFRERENLNIQIVKSINLASDAWGISCLRYEIRDIQLPARVQEAMQMQVEAERKKRARVLESEGLRESDINVAEGKKRSRILASEAEKQEKINYAQGEAQAMLVKAEARAKSIDMIGKTLSAEGGKNAGSLIVAEQYVKAFQHLAKTSNTIMLPADASNVPSMVTQAMSIYKTLSKSNELPAPSTRITDGEDNDMEEYYSDDDDRKIAAASASASGVNQRHPGSSSQFDSNFGLESNNKK